MFSVFKKLKRKMDEGFIETFVNNIKWILPYVHRYRGGVVFHLIMGIVSTLTGLASSVASKYLLDAVTGKNTGILGITIAVMIGLIVANTLFHAVTSQIALKINLKIQQTFQAEVYNQILGADWESLEDYNNGDLMNRITSDVSTISNSITGFIPSIITCTIQFVGALIIMLYYDPIMALISLSAIPFAVLASNYLVSRMMKHNKNMKEISSDVMSFYENSFSNLTGIKAFGIIPVFSGKMKSLQNRYLDESLTYNRFSIQTSVFMSILGMAVSGACFAWGLYGLWSNAITFGTMALFLQLAGYLSSSFSTLTGMASSAISLSTSIGRIVEIFNVSSENAVEEYKFEKDDEISVELSNLKISYKDGKTILENVNFKADEGELIALTGPSGEGKTTILRVLLGLVYPDNGEAVIYKNGERIPLSASTRSAFAYVPQGNAMFGGTIEENLRMVKSDATAEEIEKALKTACAWNFVQTLPGKLQYNIGGRNKGLSEGQAQRLSVARALLKKAPIMLLDEATSALDMELEKQLLKSLMTDGNVRTCIFITHREAALDFCNRQYIVDNKTVVEKQG